jgi:outer membrane protein assembly factor BamB
VLLDLALGVASCGGGQTPLNLFSTDWTDDAGRSMESVRLKLGGARPAVGADVVVAVAGNVDKLIGQPLGQPGAKWTFAHPLDSRPILAGNVVIGSGSGELFALDAKTGHKLWARPTGGLKVHGAGDDGSVSVVTMSRAVGEGSVLLAVLHDGSVVRQLETDKVLGAPAVLGGHAFVPWGSVYVSALDLANGHEAGRVVLREKTSRAFTVGGALYFGEIGFFRFDHRIKDAPQNKATHVSIPVRELPGSPKLMVPGTENPGPAASAPDRIRIYARPTGGETALAIDTDRYYATYFRLVMAFGATKGELAWVHTHGSDIIGGASGAGSVVVCDEQGRVTMLDGKTGGVVGEQDLGEPVKSCVVQVDAFTPGNAPKSSEPLAVQISEALLNREAQLATAQRLLLRELATLEDETATKTLVDLASDPRTSPVILADARTALANRRNGARFMLAALGQHYDFMKDVLRPPPVGPMAQALAAMNEKGAAPLLASHLLDPTDTDDDVKRAADALVVLGSAAEVPAMKQFFGMYRASASTDEVAGGVVSVGQALVKLGGDAGRAAVDQAMNDGLTRDDVRERLRALVPPPETEKTDGAKPPEPGKKKKTK